MGIVFSKAKLTAEDKTAEFYVGGIPRRQSDFNGWIKAEEFLNGISTGSKVNVRLKTYVYGEGVSVNATPEELAYVLMRQEKDSDFIKRRCKHEGNVIFNFIKSPEIKEGEKEMYVDEVKKQYPKGTRVAIVQMNEDPEPVPVGTKGTVDVVDDLGQIHVNWDNGRTLAIIPDVDEFLVINDKTMREKDKIVEFGDEVYAVVPGQLVDCSKLGCFDDMEEGCWDLVKAYCDKVGVKILPNEDGEIPTSYYVAKKVQDTILDELKEIGVKMTFDHDAYAEQCETEENEKGMEMGVMQ